MYRVVEHVINAVGSAGDFLTMWFHMLIVISALTTVLLHGQLSSIDNEYDIDSQFKDFYYSISTITIYLIGAYKSVQVCTNLYKHVQVCTRTY